MLDLGVTLGTLVEGVTTSLGTTTSLIDSDYANTALYDSTTFDEQYAFIVSGSNLGQQKALEAGGLDTSTGEFSVSSAYTNAVAVAVSYWLLGRLPAIKFGRFEGIRECYNSALRRLLVRRRVDIPGVTDQQMYSLSLSTYPWMKEDAILELYDPQTNALVPLKETRHKWNYKENGESPAIEFPNGAPWRTGETASMLVQCPANSWLKISGIWTNQTSPTAGLSVLTDESLAALADTTTVGLAYCYQELAKWASGTEAAEWASQERLYTSRARRLPNFQRKQRHNAGLPNLNHTRVSYPITVRR